MKAPTIIESTFLKGAFLSNYLFADVLFSRHCSPSELRIIYEKYADVFCVNDQKWLNDMWNIITLDLFSLADNINDFNRLIRLSKQYPEKISVMENYMLAQKTTAIQKKSDVLMSNDSASFDSTLQILESKANSGDTDCSALLGFLEYNGIFVNQNIEQAKRRIFTAASWNHLFAILIGCQYINKQVYYPQKLCALLNSPSNKSVWEYLYSSIQIPSNIYPDKISLALGYAFSQDHLQPHKTNNDVMKLMHSTILTEAAKIKILKSAKVKELFACEIPLNVTKKSNIVFDSQSIVALSDVRRAEVDQICSNLAMIDLRNTSVYKPLLLVCEDKLMLDYYRESIKNAFSACSTAEISLNEEDKCIISHSNDNIFVSSVEKFGDRNVVMLLDHCESLPPEACVELSKLLKASNRKQFKSAGPLPIEIDLSGTLPILFASAIPDSNIAECCDVVITKELTRSEFKNVLEHSLKKKLELFKLNSLSMDQNVSDFLFDYSSDTVTNLLNKAIGRSRASTKDIHLTVDILQSIIDKHYSSKSQNSFWRDSTI